MMNLLQKWWKNDLPVGVKLVFGLLLANALPAIVILMTLPGRTETLFVWTVTPFINARLMGVMYANAIILVALGMFQTSWERVRIVVVVIAIFSVLATTLTFFFLKPFLAHPWFHLAFWLSMYLALFFVAPYILISFEIKRGGQLPVEVRLHRPARWLAWAFMLLGLLCGLGLIFYLEGIQQLWPWQLPPLVAGLIGVLCLTHAAAFAWALWDGDWLRVQPIFWQAPLTGLLFILLPFLHQNDLQTGTGNQLALYLGMAGLIVVSSSIIILSYRGIRKEPQYT
jgi:hypothetical protein